MEKCECGKEKVGEYNLCQECLEKTVAEFQKKMKDLLDKEISRMKKKGATWMAQTWIHPRNGDDYQANFYFFKKPTYEQIQSILKKKGSQVLTDYIFREI